MQAVRLGEDPRAVIDRAALGIGRGVVEPGDARVDDRARAHRAGFERDPQLAPVEPLAADKKLLFKTEVAPDLPQGRGDERRLTQVLLNLVGNAIKFTDVGEVTIRVAAANGSFSVAVHDTGPGIGAADQTKLFQESTARMNKMMKKGGPIGLWSATTPAGGAALSGCAGRQPTGPGRGPCANGRSRYLLIR